MNPEWVDDVAAVPELVSLFIRCAGTVYICQGELLDGRAGSASSWSADLPAVLAKEFAEAIESGKDPFARNRGRNGTRNGGILAVRIDGAVAGFALVELRRPPLKPPYAFINDIVVDPASRDRGLGSALMARLKDELVAAGVDRIFLESGSGNIRAHGFFERHGFRKLSVSMMADLGPASLQ